MKLFPKGKKLTSFKKGDIVKRILPINNMGGNDYSYTVGDGTHGGPIKISYIDNKRVYFYLTDRRGKFVEYEFSLDVNREDWMSNWVLHKPEKNEIK